MAGILAGVLILKSEQFIMEVQDGNSFKCSS